MSEGAGDMKQWLTPEERQSYREGNMKTEWGFRNQSGYEAWTLTKELALEYIDEYPGAVLIAREVSDPRVVSIRG